MFYVYRVCNPVRYDRLKRLYIQEFSPALVVPFCTVWVSPRLIDEHLDSDSVWIIMTQSPSSSSPAWSHHTFESGASVQKYQSIFLPFVVSAGPAPRTLLFSQ